MLLKPIPPAELFDLHVSEHAQGMRMAAGVSDDAFRKTYAPHLLRLARVVQRLPLSPNAFPLPDGAIRCASYGCLLALRLAQNAIFAPDAGSALRRELTPQYRFAVFAAALGTIYVDVYRNVRVKVGGNSWDVLNELPLHDAASLACGEYAIAWQPDGLLSANPQLDAMVFMSAFPPGFWHRFHLRVLQDMALALSPAKNALSETPMQKLIRTAREKVFELESSRIAQNAERIQDIPMADSQDATGMAAPGKDNGSEAPAASTPKSQLKPTHADRVMAPASEAINDPVQNMPLKARQFFQALMMDEQWPQMREKIIVNKDYISMPFTFFGRYGQPMTQAVEMLKTMDLLIEKKEKEVRLVPQLASVLKLV
uniref:Uncharacterized domain-containing protein n=1 Tax=mine drainage metagenome TaxID=410659 RepID=E6QMW0_9ZZZZ